MTATTVPTSTTSPMPWTLQPAPTGKSMPCIRDAKGRAVAFVNRGAAAEANSRLLSNAPATRQLLNQLVDTLAAIHAPAIGGPSGHSVDAICATCAAIATATLHLDTIGAFEDERRALPNS